MKRDLKRIQKKFERTRYAKEKSEGEDRCAGKRSHGWKSSGRWSVELFEIQERTTYQAWRIPGIHARTVRRMLMMKSAPAPQPNK